MDASNVAEVAAGTNRAGGEDAPMRMSCRTVGRVGRWPADMSYVRRGAKHLGFKTIQDSTAELSVIARLHALPKHRRMSRVNDLADRYGVGPRAYGFSGHAEYVDYLMEAAEVVHPLLRADEPKMWELRSANPSPPPLSCTRILGRGARRGMQCGDMVVGSEATCFAHTDKRMDSLCARRMAPRRVPRRVEVYPSSKGGCNCTVQSGKRVGMRCGRLNCWYHRGALSSAGSGEDSDERSDRPEVWGPGTYYDDGC